MTTLKHTDKKRGKSRTKRMSRIRRSQAKSGPPIVSDHAVVRYLERVKGMDIAALREEICDDLALAAMDVGATTIKTDRAVLTIKEGRVVTVNAR